ncbi:MAG: hypothetical protein U1E65_26760 [Myxococcota bacterium]
MKKILFGLWAALSLTAVACGSGDICTASSKCSADPARTQMQTDACKAAVAAAKCSTEYKAAANCAIDNQKCTAANMTDVVATSSACATVNAAYATCLTAM